MVLPIARHAPAPVVVLPTALRTVVAEHLAAEYPLEGCGVLLGRTAEADHPGDANPASPPSPALRLTRALPCANVAEPGERRRRFAIDPRVVVRLQRELRGTGEEVAGFYHSHPDAEAEPSSTDMEFFRLWPRTLWLMVPVRDGRPGEPRAWWLHDAESEASVELKITRSPHARAPSAAPAADVPDPAHTDPRNDR